MTAASTPALAAAVAIVDELARTGVRHVCLAPGARSGPLALAAVSHPALRDWMVTDERAAGFFALGMARQLGAPVGVVCTSGTAAANLLPAVVEAALSEVPMVVLTADRPPELRACAAAQTIDQVGLFGGHVRWAMDLPVPEGGVDLDGFYRRVACRAVATACAPPAGPVHLNVPLREPLLPAGALPALDWPAGADAPPAVAVPRATPRLDDEAALARLAATLADVEEGLVVCGPRAVLAGAGTLVGALASRLGWPVLVDPLSGLRFGGDDVEGAIDAYDLVLRDEAFAAAHRPRAVLRLGAPPVSKALGLHLEAARPAVHVVVATPGTWPDPAHRASAIVQAEPASVLAALRARVPARAATAWRAAWLAAARRARAVVAARLAAEEALFEGKVMAEVVARLPAGAVLHVGNSMPVRDLDAFGARTVHALRVDCNRGANGIDGVLATTLGAAAVSGRPTVLVVGDLSFLHDVGALQIAARHALDAVVVVVNNDGGGVFSFLPWAGDGAIFERVFGTPHGLDLAGAASSCGARHRRIGDWPAFGRALAEALARPGLDVVEVPSDRRRNAALHGAYVADVVAGLRAERRSDAA